MGEKCGPTIALNHSKQKNCGSTNFELPLIVIHQSGANCSSSSSSPEKCDFHLCSSIPSSSQLTEHQAPSCSTIQYVRPHSKPISANLKSVPHSPLTTDCVHESSEHVEQLICRLHQLGLHSLVAPDEVSHHKQTLARKLNHLLKQNSCLSVDNLIQFIQREQLSSTSKESHQSASGHVKQLAQWMHASTANQSNKGCTLLLELLDKWKHNLHSSSIMNQASPNKKRYPDGTMSKRNKEEMELSKRVINFMTPGALPHYPGPNPKRLLELLERTGI